MKKMLCLILMIIIMLSSGVIAKDYGDYESVGIGKVKKCMLKVQTGVASEYQGLVAEEFCECTNGDYIHNEVLIESICVIHKNEYKAWDYFWYMFRYFQL